jgi:hypothetical protein
MADGGIHEKQTSIGHDEHEFSHKSVGEETTSHEDNRYPSRSDEAMRDGSILKLYPSFSKE